MALITFSEQQIKTLKKIGWGILNFLYYFLIFPAFFHGLYKIGTFIFAPKPPLQSKLVKSYDAFQYQPNTPASVKQQKNGELAGYHPKLFFQKKKNQTMWLGKVQSLEEMVNELILGEAFRLMLGNDCAPKYRVMISRAKYTISKLLENFEQFFDDEKKYNKDQYIQTIANIKDFQRMVAVCLLFGKEDLHFGNWGCIVRGEERKAATVDHGKTFFKINGTLIYQYLYKCGHRKEMFLDKAFISACKQVIIDFDNKRQAIEAACKEGLIAAQMVSDPDFKLKSIEEVMEILQYNRNQLMNLYHHIKCEMAIATNNGEKLKKNAAKFTKEYKNFGIISLQNNRDNCLPLYEGLGFFIIHNEALDENEVDRSKKTITPEQQLLLKAYKEGLNLAGFDVNSKGLGNWR